jgi:hypothetical protein
MEPSGIRTPPAFTKSIQRFPSAGGLALRSESEQPAIEAAFPNEPKVAPARRFNGVGLVQRASAMSANSPKRPNVVFYRMPKLAIFPDCST